MLVARSPNPSIGASGPWQSIHNTHTSYIIPPVRQLRLAGATIRDLGYFISSISL